MNMARSEAITELMTHIGGIKRSLQNHSYSCGDGSSLTSGQLSLLFAIKHHGPISAQDLANRLALTPGAVSQVVDGLLASGYLNRVPRADSRHTLDLSLTPIGATKVTAIEHKRHAIIEQTTEELTDTELQTFASIMQKILLSLQNERNTEANESKKEI
jgi:DNA-binding MarR family transcriptional regulator